MRKLRNATRRPTPAVYWSPEAQRFLANRAALRSSDRSSYVVEAVLRTQQVAAAVSALLVGRD